jgi:hypothetical protein
VGWDARAALLVGLMGWLVGGVRVVPWCLVAVVGLGLGYVLHWVWVRLVGIRLLGFRAWWDG